MAEGRQRDEWDRAASVTCAVYSVLRAFSKDSKPLSPAQFNPFRKPARDKPIPITFDQLKGILFPGQQ